MVLQVPACCSLHFAFLSTHGGRTYVADGLQNAILELHPVYPDIYSWLLMVLIEALNLHTDAAPDSGTVCFEGVDPSGSSICPAMPPSSSASMPAPSSIPSSEGRPSRAPVALRSRQWSCSELQSGQRALDKVKLEEEGNASPDAFLERRLQEGGCQL